MLWRNGGGIMKWMLAAVAMCAAVPGAARDLAVPADKSWQHAATGVVLRPVIDGLARGGISDATTDEFDVTVQYELPDKSAFATIYLYKPGIDSVGMWFDRSQAAIQRHDQFRHAAPATIDPVAFAIRAGGPASALRQVYAIPGGAYRSTALAVVPVAKWLVTVRMSAHTLTADQLDAQLTRFLSAIRWPADAMPARVAAPLAACASDLTFGSARQVKPNGGDVLIALMAGMAQSTAKAAENPEAVTWCRDGFRADSFGVYRANGSTDAYVMAVQDAGRVVTVAPSLIGKAEGRGDYTITLTDVDGSVQALPSFNTMPAPRQVWALLK